MNKHNRLVDHITLKVKNLERSKIFYRAIAETLGHAISQENQHGFYVDGLLITQDKDPSHSVHLSFHASNPGVVKLFHQTAVAAGGFCITPPQDAPVNQDQYAAVVMDPDGNNVEVFFRSTRAL